MAVALLMAGCSAAGVSATSGPTATAAPAAGSRLSAAAFPIGQSSFSHLFDLMGGISAWQSAGGHVVTE